MRKAKQVLQVYLLVNMLTNVTHNSHKRPRQEIYQKIYMLTKQNGKRVSDLVNEALKAYIQNQDDPIGLEQQDPIIENAGTLMLTKSVIINIYQELQKESVDP